MKKAPIFTNCINQGLSGQKEVEEYTYYKNKNTI